MADLGRLLGSLLGSLAHARRIADEETAAIAEYYKNNPLLEGMSLPRVRVPELVLELPMLIEAYEEGKASVLEDKEVIFKTVMEELHLAAEKGKVPLTKELVQRFEQEVKTELENIQAGGESDTGYARELVVRAIDKAFNSAITNELTKITPVQRRDLSSALRLKAGKVALKKEGIPSKIVSSIITSEIKEKASSGNVVRLRVTMKEEGLEWSIGENKDGTVTRKLTPE